MNDRVLLIGLGPTTQSALESLLDRFTVIGLVRHENPLESDPVVKYAESQNIPVYFDASSDGISKLIVDLQPQCVVISSFNRIIGPEILRLAPFINVHYAPLPQYRGRANVNWAIINGEKEAAISIHTVVPGLDAGHILFQRTIPIGPHDTIDDLYRALNELQRTYLATTVAHWLSGYKGEPQSESEATYGCTRVPADGMINWDTPTMTIYALIRALVDPFPGAFTFVDGKKLIIRRASPVECPPKYVGRIPGRMVGRSRREGWVDVLTADGVLRIFEVQKLNEQPIPAAQVVTSSRQTLGLSTLDLLSRISELEQKVAQLRAINGIA